MQFEGHGCIQSCQWVVHFWAVPLTKISWLCHYILSLRKKPFRMRSSNFFKGPDPNFFFTEHPLSLYVCTRACESVYYMHAEIISAILCGCEQAQKVMLLCQRSCSFIYITEKGLNFVSICSKLGSMRSFFWFF